MTENDPRWEPGEARRTVQGRHHVDTPAAQDTASPTPAEAATVHQGAATTTPAPLLGSPRAASAGTATDSAVPVSAGAEDGDAAGTAPAAEGESESTSRRGRHRGSKASFWRELPILIVIALGLALLIKAFVVQAFYIPSGSMENTLLINDRVLVNKLVYDFRSVHRGEIVVFNGKGTGFPAEVHVAPASNPVQGALRGLGQALGVGPPSESDFIKRVIGVGGDHVICCDSAGRVTVNGAALTEPYLFPGDAPSTQPFNVVVPKGQLFVMGDHRSDSADSRAHGTIPADRVIGRAFVRVWPVSRIGLLHVPATFHRKTISAAGGAAGVASVAGLVAVPALRRRRRSARRHDQGAADGLPPPRQ